MKIYPSRIAAFAAVGALAIVTQPAVAQSENAAAVITAGECHGWVPTPDGGLGEPLVTYNKHRIINKNNGMAICQFDIPEGHEPDTVVTSDAFVCTIDGKVADYKLMQATPGGRAFITCRVH